MISSYSKREVTCTEIKYWVIWGAFFHFILYLAYISYCLLCSVRTRTFCLCVLDSSSMCKRWGWCALRRPGWQAVFFSQPACQVLPRTEMCLWVSYYHCVTVWLDIHLPPQKWKNAPQSQSLDNVMCAKLLVKWERGFSFVSIQSNRKV